MDPRIADYIRENRRRYTREALTKQLIAAGHDPGEVERVWAALDARDVDEVAGEGFWARFALILIGINVAVFFAVGLLTGMLANPPDSGIVLVILAIAMAIGALISWGIVAATGPTKLSPRTALVVGSLVPALFALLIGGGCYALIGGLGGMGTSGPPVTPAVVTIELENPLHLSTTGEGSCEAQGPTAADGFFIYGFAFNEAGQQVDINVSPQPAGGGVEAIVWVSATIAEKGGEVPISWGNEGGESGEIELMLDGMNGTVRFSNLPPYQDDASGWGDPLSGQISWECGS